jgi:hypothetical protein
MLEVVFFTSERRGIDECKKMISTLARAEG